MMENIAKLVKGVKYLAVVLLIPMLYITALPKVASACEGCTYRWQRIPAMCSGSCEGYMCVNPGNECHAAQPQCLCGS